MYIHSIHVIKLKYDSRFQLQALFYSISLSSCACDTYSFCRHCDKDSKEKNAITSFSLPEEVADMNISVSSEKVDFDCLLCICEWQLINFFLFAYKDPSLTENTTHSLRRRTFLWLTRDDIQMEDRSFNMVLFIACAI